MVGILLADDQAGLQAIRLKDNTVIHAKVIEEAGGFYLAKSPTLGDLKIPTGNVISIKNGTPSGPNAGEPASETNSTGMSSPSATTPVQAGIDALRSTVSSKVQNLAATREGMAVIEQFSQNQDVKAILGDPATLKAIQSGDYNAVMKSPSMQKLMDNPQTKSLINNVLAPAPQDGPQPKTGGKPDAPE